MAKTKNIWKDEDDCKLSGTILFTSADSTSYNMNIYDSKINVVRDYIKNYIDDYLFHDVDSIIEHVPNKHPGAAAYPILLSVLSGIELLGALLMPSEKDYSYRQGNDYFIYYWDKYLANGQPVYKNYGEIARQLIRNGLAHLFTTKSKIGVVRSRNGTHLTIDKEGQLIIDATQFYNDFKNSYLNKAKPRLLDNAKGTELAHKRLCEISKKHNDECETEFADFYNKQ